MLAAAPAALTTVAMAEPTVARVAGTTSCAGQTWPYVARECLAAAEGTPARRGVRTIGTGTR